MLGATGINSLGFMEEVWLTGGPDGQVGCDMRAAAIESGDFTGRRKEDLQERALMYHKRKMSLNVRCYYGYHCPNLDLDNHPYIHESESIFCSCSPIVSASNSHAPVLVPSP